MSIIDKIFAFAKVSEAVKKTATALIAIGGAILTLGGAKDFFVKNGITSIEDARQIVFVTDHHREIQGILKGLAEGSKADRAFLVLFKQNKEGRWFTEFKSDYQWQLDGQVQIKNALYPIAPGADKDRFETMNRRMCKETIASNLNSQDELGIAMAKSGAIAQVACQVNVKIKRKEALGAIVLEFGSPSYNRTQVETKLVEASIGVEDIFN